MAVVIGVDCGTQSTKVLLYDSVTKALLAQASSPHELRSLGDGTREEEASWWIYALKDAFSKIDHRLRGSAEAIGVSAQQQGFVPMTKSGEVLCPVKLWCDTTSAPESLELMERLGGAEKMLKDTGNRMMPGHTASKILQLRKKRPDLYRLMKVFLLPHDYINWYLTGNFTMELGDASATGLLDIRQRRWHEGVLAAIDPERDWTRVLPPLIEAGASVGLVGRMAANELGIPEGMPVATGGGDNMMSAIGTGAVADGVFVLSMGTSGTLFTTSSTPVIDPAGLVEAYCSSTGSWFPLISTMNCTFAADRIRRLFDKDMKTFNALAEKAPIGCEGIFMIPYLNGERTPNYPNGEGLVAGLDATNVKQENIARASMESAVYTLKIGADAFEALGFSMSDLRMTGGGAGSSLWRQMVSDMFMVPVTIPRISESSAFGAALDALWTLEGGRISSVANSHVAFDEGPVASPNKGAHDAYLSTFRKFKEYIECLDPLFR